MTDIRLGEPRSRALIALLRYMHGPVLFDMLSFPGGIVLPAMDVMIFAADPRHPLDQQQLRRKFRRASFDLVAVTVDEEKQGYPLRFDIHIRSGDKMPHLHACEFFISPRGDLMFLTGYPTGTAVLVELPGLRLIPHPAMTTAERFIGLVRGQAALAQVVWGPRSCVEAQTNSGILD